MIVVRPFLKMDWRVDDVLHSVQNDRPSNLRHPQQSFHPQHLRAVPMQKEREPDAERGPINLFLDAKREGLDVNRVVTTEVNVFDMAVMVLMMNMLGTGAFEPMTNLGKLGVGVGDTLGQQHICIKQRSIDVENSGSWVESPERRLKRLRAIRFNHVGLCDYQTIGHRGLTQRFVVLVVSCSAPSMPSTVVTMLANRT